MSSLAFLSLPTGTGGQEGFPSALEVETGEHRGILPLQLPGIGVMNEERDFSGIDVRQDSEELPAP